MEIKKHALVVRSFHYDVLETETKPVEDIQVSLGQVSANTPEGQEEEKQGNIYEMRVPFNIVPQGNIFRVAGEVTQIIQTVGFFGELSDLDDNQMRGASSDIIDVISKMTFDITKDALDYGAELNFQAVEE